MSSFSWSQPCICITVTRLWYFGFTSYSDVYLLSVFSFFLEVLLFFFSLYSDKDWKLRLYGTNCFALSDWLTIFCEVHIQKRHFYHLSINLQFFAYQLFFFSSIAVNSSIPLHISLQWAMPYVWSVPQLWTPWRRTLGHKFLSITLEACFGMWERTEYQTQT